MTDGIALLVNLLTLAESGKLEGKLEVSRTYYDPATFTPKRDVRVDGQYVCSVNNEEMADAQVIGGWEVLNPSIVDKYVNPSLSMISLMPKGFFE